jgi:hypothetical protein
MVVERDFARADYNDFTVYADQPMLSQLHSERTNTRSECEATPV